MAISTSFKSTVNSAYGKELPSPVTVSGTYQAIDPKDQTEVSAIKSSKEWPNDEQIVAAYLNPRRLAAAKAKATTEALDAAGIEKPAKDDPEVIRKNLVANMLLAGMSQEDAETMADSIAAKSAAKTGA